MIGERKSRAEAVWVGIYFQSDNLGGVGAEGRRFLAGDSMKSGRLVADCEAEREMLGRVPGLEAEEADPELLKGLSKGTAARFLRLRRDFPYFLVFWGCFLGNGLYDAVTDAFSFKLVELVRRCVCRVEEALGIGENFEGER